MRGGGRNLNLKKIQERNLNLRGFSCSLSESLNFITLYSPVYRTRLSGGDMDGLRVAVALLAVSSGLYVATTANHVCTSVGQ